MEAGQTAQNPPAVSVIIAARNAERSLAQALDSVAAQTWPAAEVFVVDGHSTDDTLGIARRYAFVQVLRQAGQGFADAWNIGLRAASGDLIAFIDADDRWEPHKLQLQATCLLDEPETACVAAHMRFFVEPGQALPPRFDPRLLARDHIGLHPSNLLVRQWVFARWGLFGTDWEIASDIEWTARIQAEGVRIKVLPEVLLHKGIHANNLSLSAEGPELIHRELLRLLRASLQRKRRRPANETKTE